MFVFLPLTGNEAQLAKARVEDDALPASAFALLVYTFTVPFPVALLAAFAPRRSRSVDRGVRMPRR